MSSPASLLWARRAASLAVLAMAVLAVASFAAIADEPEGAVTGAARVEEDWELVVDDADPSANSPQVTCTMGTMHDLGGVHAVLEINHRSLPSYSAGGLQIQTWSGETALDHKTLEKSEKMNTTGETIRWTMFLKDAGEKLVFGVENGSSETWGYFGGANLHVDGGEVSDLDHYCPDCSVGNSSVGFSGNRVQSLVLKEVRWYDKHGNLLHKDSDERVVHQK